jgi:hypothetical protein
MISRLFGVVLLFLASQGQAQMSLDSPIVRALSEGRISVPLPPSPGAMQAAQKIQAKTGNAGEVTVEYFVVTKFLGQGTCGRVGYGLYQRSTNTLWGQFGGQLNVCANGMPPLRTCGGSAVLVPAGKICPDGSMSEDTPEVKDAIAAALAAGGLNVQQMRAVVRAHNPVGRQAK